MKLAPMNYHYLRYPVRKFLDKVADSPFDSIDLYCSAPQLNMFDYTLGTLLELDREIRERGLSVRIFWAARRFRSVPDLDILTPPGRKPGIYAGILWRNWLRTVNAGR